MNVRLVFLNRRRRMLFMPFVLAGTAHGYCPMVIVLAKEAVRHAAYTQIVDTLVAGGRIADSSAANPAATCRENG